MIASVQGVCLAFMGALLSSKSRGKSRGGPRLVLQPPGRRTARHSTKGVLKRFFAIADAWELSPLQQCRLLKIPSPQVLERYRLGQAPRLSALQQERAALVAHIHRSLTRDSGSADRAWAFVHTPLGSAPFGGDSPLYFMLENGLPALREVARLLARAGRTPDS
jgi:hypothetical protein